MRRAVGLKTQIDFFLTNSLRRNLTICLHFLLKNTFKCEVLLFLSRLLTMSFVSVLIYFVLQVDEALIELDDVTFFCAPIRVKQVYWKLNLMTAG